MEYEYSVTCTNDNETTPSYVGRFDNALEAVKVYLACVDHGFALEYRTVNLSEPNGKMHTKILYRGGKVVTK